MYSSPYNYSNTYSTGAYTLLLGTNIGNTGTYFDMSHRTYPVACAVSCGNGSTEINEQCDDGNLNNNDGCSDVCLLEIAPTCGDGAVNQQNEQCDDGNADEFDGCDSQCTTNSCSTTVLHTIDPMITYQRGYPSYSPNTGMTFIFTTPTAGTGYTYQRSVS
jgi:cysteine-rich repeat protein